MTRRRTPSRPIVTQAMPGLGRWLMRLSDVADALDSASLLEWASAAPAGLAAGPGLSEGPERTYRRIATGPAVEAWLIRWGHGHDTGFHDHDTSSGAVRVLAGELFEETLAIGGPPLRQIHRTGSSFCFGPEHIHRMRHAGAAGAVSLHLYSPPLHRMGCYEVAAGGELRRLTVGAETELRPLSVV
jgi:hypothetical protein